MEVDILYVGFQSLKMKCTQHGICNLVAFKNARALVFSKSGGAGINVIWNPENVNFFLGGGGGGLPLPVSTSHEKLVGGGLTSTKI